MRPSRTCASAQSGSTADRAIRERRERVRERTLNIRHRLSDFAAPTLCSPARSTGRRVDDAADHARDRHESPGSTYRELPGTPHMHTLEQPDLVAAALANFLP
jgi:pimeloyl-ACP methyl ester carboxylesterase